MLYMYTKNRLIAKIQTLLPGTDTPTGDPLRPGPIDDVAEDDDDA